MGKDATGKDPAAEGVLKFIAVFLFGGHFIHIIRSKMDYKPVGNPTFTHI